MNELFWIHCILNQASGHCLENQLPISHFMSSALIVSKPTWEQVVIPDIWKLTEDKVSEGANHKSWMSKNVTINARVPRQSAYLAKASLDLDKSQFWLASLQLWYWSTSFTLDSCYLHCQYCLTSSVCILHDSCDRWRIHKTITGASNLTIHPLCHHPPFFLPLSCQHTFWRERLIKKGDIFWTCQCLLLNSRERELCQFWLQELLSSTWTPKSPQHWSQTSVKLQLFYPLYSHLSPLLELHLLH